MLAVSVSSLVRTWASRLVVVFEMTSFFSIWFVDKPSPVARSIGRRSSLPTSLFRRMDRYGKWRTQV